MQTLLHIMNDSIMQIALIHANVELTFSHAENAKNAKNHD
jgi:hypothetical protein